MRYHPIPSSGSVRRRGSAILLAVGCLAMLAILATAYLISSRTESITAGHVSAATNYDGARDRMLEHFRSKIYQATLCPTDATAAAQPALANTRPLSVYWRPPIMPSHKLSNQQLVHNVSAGGGEGSIGVVYFKPDFSKTPVLPKNFSSIPNFVAGNTPVEASYSGSNMINPCKVTTRDLPTFPDFEGDGTLPTGTSAGNSWMGLNNQADNSTDPGNVGPVSDNLYFWGSARVEDTNRMLNLNTAWPTANATPTDIDPDGRYTFGYRLRSVGASGDDPTAIGNARVTTAYTKDQWRAALASTPGTTMRLFDLQDELELRSYGHRGTGLNTRLVATWPNVLTYNPAAIGGPDSANTRYQNAKIYTTYSYDRDNLRPLNDHPTVGAVANAVWPNNGMRVPINPTSAADLSVNATDVMNNTAYLASAMLASGYPADEAYSFAANYASQRSLATGIVRSTGVDLVNPEAVGLSGAAAGAALPGPFDTNYQYLGLRPQPFITELGVRLKDQNPAPPADPTNTPTQWGTTDVEAWAVELYNPFPVAINLAGWEIRTGAGTVSIGAGTIPANGTFVVASDAALIAASVPAGQRFLTVTRLSTPAVTPFVVGDYANCKLYLLRPYGGGFGLLPVDRLDYGRLYPATPPVAVEYHFLARPATDSWQCMLNVVSKHQVGTTLGVYPGGGGASYVNPLTGAAYAANLNLRTILQDRFANNNTLTVNQPMSFRDFHRLWRIAHKVTTNPANYSQCVFASDMLRNRWQWFAPAVNQDAGFGVMTNAIIANDPANPKGSEQWKVDASVRFNFISATPQDLRADRLQHYLRFQGSYEGPLTAAETQSGRLTTPLDRNRIPGRINLNTANIDTLTILFSGVLDTTSNPDLTICTTAGDAAWWANKLFAERIKDRNGTTYNGFRDISALANSCISQITLSSTTTLDQRDALWVRLYPMTTFRSDTWVLWGYILNATPGSDKALIPSGGERRFVAILDGSWANRAPSEGGSPQDVRVLAVKQMPR